MNMNATPFKTFAFFCLTIQRMRIQTDQIPVRTNASFCANIFYFFFQIEFGLIFSHWICGPSQLFRIFPTVHLAPVVNAIKYSSVLEVGNDGSFGMVPVLKKDHQHDPGYGLGSI